jgi:hypothetical protein
LCGPVHFDYPSFFAFILERGINTPHAFLLTDSHTDMNWFMNAWETELINCIPYIFRYGAKGDSRTLRWSTVRSKLRLTKKQETTIVKWLRIFTSIWNGLASRLRWMPKKDIVTRRRCSRFYCLEPARLQGYFRIRSGDVASCGKGASRNFRRSLHSRGAGIDSTAFHSPMRSAGRRRGI